MSGPPHRVHPKLLFGAEIGDTVRVGYLQSPTGSRGLRTLVYSGAATITGTVTGLTGSSLTVQSASGQIHVLDASLVAHLLSGIQAGSGVRVTYSGDTAGPACPPRAHGHQSAPAAAGGPHCCTAEAPVAAAAPGS